MKKFAFIILFLSVIASLLFSFLRRDTSKTLSPLGIIRDKPLDKYTIEQLSKRRGVPSQIKLDEAIATASGWTAYNFHFKTEGKKVTGLAHVPQGVGPFPVILQMRGYIDKETYRTGDGTKRSGEVFAVNGFLTLAPDFLGYGGSDMPSGDIFEERFETYTTALDLFSSISTLPTADEDRVGIWGHSNGGQIALTVLEIMQEPVPTVLWAPVSKPFPYSILYYTDEFSDRGKLLRKRLAEFENEYDVELYSLPNYLDRITAPIQLEQGTNDVSVPQGWSDELVRTLKEKGKDTRYTISSGADHNMLGNWNAVVLRNVSFFKETLE